MAEPTRPGPLHNLGNLGRAVDAADLRRLVGEQGASHVRQDQAWALRFHGTGIGHDVINLDTLSQLAHDLDRTTFWMSSSLYPGHRHTAGAQAALAGNSIVVLLVPGVNEPAVEIGDEIIYPSVEAGRYLTSLYAAAGDPEQLSGLLSPLNGNARGAYIKQVTHLADAGVGVDSIVRVPDSAGVEQALRQVSLTATQAEEEKELLLRRPTYKIWEQDIDGVFVGWSKNKLRFTLSRDDEQGEISGIFPEELTDVVGSLQNRRVVATIRFEEPEFSWMPRRSSTLLLRSVDRLADRRTFG